MNILYYCDEYPPARNGGIGTVVKLVAEAMSQRGHNVIVAGRYWNGKGRKTVENINGVTVIRWQRRSYDSIALFWRTLFAAKKNRHKRAQIVFSRTQKLLEKAIARYSVDLVEMPDYVDDFLYNYGIKTVPWKSSVPRVIRVHGSVSFLHHYLKGRPDERKIKQDRDYFALADAVYAVSAFSKAYVSEYLCPGKDVTVIYNPIEEHWFKQSVENEGSQTILFFGKIAKMKGVFSLIKAFNLISADFPEAKLMLVGNGDVAKAQGLVDPRYSDRVVFAGFMPQERVMAEIDDSGFCVLPSYFENFSMAALEVLARHKALIYTDRTSGHELIQDGINGLLVDPDNVEQIADGMRLLLKDIELRNRLADNGFEMCRNRFSTEIILPEIESYYEEVIKRCKDSRR